MTVYFNNVPGIRENFQKQLGLFLGSKLNLCDHINEKTKKSTPGINVIRTMNFITNKITRSLNIIFVDKKFDVIILSYYIKSNM